MLNLTHGGLSGGYQKYLQSMAPLLNAHEDIQELLQVVPPQYQTLTGLGSKVYSWNAGEQWRGFPALRARVRQWNPDVVFVPTARFLDCNAPCVCMVRNMEPMLSPTLRDGIRTWTKRRLGVYLAERACHSATRVVAVSEFVRDFLVRDWNVEAGKVGVVYHGVDEPASDETCPAKFVSLRGNPFLFAAGSLLPYRGLEDAIAALAQTSVPSLRLAIAGEGSSSYRERMQHLANLLGVSNRILWLGHLTEPDMSWAYAHCSAFVMTSRVEACPNTALEAMASSAVSISTRSSPMPEFFQQSALYYDAGDVTQLASQIQVACALSDTARQELQHRALTRSRDFTWQQTANATVRQLQLAIAEHAAITGPANVRRVKD